MMFIPVFNCILLILLTMCFSVFLFVMGFKMGKSYMYKEFYTRLLKNSDEKIMSIIKTLRIIK